MGKATEDSLGDLHGAVADLLTDVVANGVTVGIGEDGQPVKATAPAAYVVAALAMLKQNNITADPGTNAALQGLAAQLAARRAQGKKNVSASALDAATTALERDLGGMMQ